VNGEKMHLWSKTGITTGMPAVIAGVTEDPLYRNAIVLCRAIGSYRFAEPGLSWIAPYSVMKAPAELSEYLFSVT
jgi:hypothetical protein